MKAQGQGKNDNGGPLNTETIDSDVTNYFQNMTQIYVIESTNLITCVYFTSFIP